MQKFLTVAQAAKRIGVTGETVRKMYDRGELDGTRTIYGRAISKASVERARRRVAAKRRKAKVS